MRSIRSTTAIVMSACLVTGAGVTAVAEADEPVPAAPVAFTASLACSDEVPMFAGEDTEQQLAPDLTVSVLPTPTWSMTVREATDPRLDGAATFALDGEGYWKGPSVAEAADPSLADVMVGTLRIETADGAWEGTTYLLSLADEPQFAADVVALSGSRAYEGQVILTELRQGANVCSWQLRGAVVERGLPASSAVAGE